MMPTLSTTPPSFESAAMTPELMRWIAIFIFHRLDEPHTYADNVISRMGGGCTLFRTYVRRMSDIDHAFPQCLYGVIYQDFAGQGAFQKDCTRN